MTLDPADIDAIRKLWSESGGLLRQENVGADYAPLDEPDDDSKTLFASIGPLLDEIDRLTGQLAVARAERDVARREAQVLRCVEDELMGGLKDADGDLATALKLAGERDAALARVAELEAQLAGARTTADEIAELVRALPDAEPPAGYVERAEVRRLEVAVVEAVLAERDSEEELEGYLLRVHPNDVDEQVTSRILARRPALAQVRRNAVDALRAASDRSGKAGGE